MWSIVPQPEPAPEPKPSAFRLEATNDVRPNPAPDLDSQVESLFDEVWIREREQDLIRRIELAIRAEEFREKSRRRAKKKP